jgi:pimeloyl-ACP methyl ester carboxylesterase
MKLLHSTIIGTGSPLLILHGYFGMSDNWKTLGKKLSENFEVHLIDQRNHGRSFHSDSFDYELMVEDLHYYIQQHNLKKVHVLGHSMGGKVAMFFAVNYPELMDHLVVADISPKYYKPHHSNILEGLNTVNFSIQNNRRDVEEVLKTFIPEPAVLQFLLKNVYWKSKGELDYRFNLQSLTENNSEIGEALHSFTHFEGPSLFLKGENSDYITHEDIPLISAHFPNYSLITVKNAGHWLHAENPAQFLAEVVSFLS